MVFGWNGGNEASVFINKFPATPWRWLVLTLYSMTSLLNTLHVNNEHPWHEFFIYNTYGFEIASNNEGCNLQTIITSLYHRYGRSN
jgi:hypothetical protein